MTPRQLQSTKILNDFFKFKNKTIKGNAWRFFKQETLRQITKGIKQIRLQNKKSEKSKKSQLSQYLENLKWELEHLHIHQTTDKRVKARGRKLKQMIKAMQLYLQEETLLNRKDYATDLFYLSIFQMFKELKFNKRLEIIADIYLISDFEPDDYKGWKSKHPEEYHEAISTVRKRIYRAKQNADQLLKSEPYHDRRMRLLQSMKKHGIKRKLRTKEAKINEQINVLKEARRKEPEPGPSIDAFLMSTVLKKLRISNPTKLLTFITEEL